MWYSKYNIVIKEKREAVVLYNSAYGSICELENSQYKALITSREICSDFPYYAELEELGVITGNNEFFSRSQKQNTLTIVISLTSKCNLSCYYCFENRNISTSHTKVSQSWNIENILRQYFKKDLSTTKLHLIWFGGEPMIELWRLKTLSKQILSICDEYNVDFSASIITNGTIYNHELICDLPTLHISHIQVSADGHYDKFIENKNGSQKLWDNHIKFLQTASDHTNVTIRLNIDKLNSDSIKKYLQFLKEQHVIDKINIVFAKIDTKESKYCISLKEYYTLKLELLSYIAFDLNYSREDSIFCELTSIDTPCNLLKGKSIVIDSNGYCHKCEDDVGKTSDVSVHKTESCIQLIDANKLPYNHICKNCSIFPLCKGDCPRHWKMEHCKYKREYIKRLALLKYRFLTN